MEAKTRRVRVARRALAPLAGAMLALLACGGSAYARPAGSEAVPLINKAPSVTKNPASKTVEEGQPASFESAASGTPTPTVQWELSTNGGSSWSAIEGATSDQLTIASTKLSENGDEFRATFTNVVGQATSKVATLTVHAAPSITEQPRSVTVNEGENATFESTATGSPTPTVQWQQSVNGGSSWTNVKEATSTQLTISKATTSLSGHEYRAVFKNSVGEAKSEAATLTVQKAPAVTKQPASVTARAGEAATFEASASGFPTPSVQWEVSTNGGSSWTAIEGATSSKYTIAEVKSSEDGYEFRATFTNTAGSATSEAATLTVHSPPLITEQPQSTTVEAGETATFQAAASGYPEPTVQWEVSSNQGSSWSTISGATSDVLTLEDTTTAESGNEYRAVFTNLGGSVTTTTATLTVAATKYSAIAWGSNLQRQLGSGSSNVLSNVPVPVSSLKFVTAVAAGGSHSLALLANGTVMAWGDNTEGQLGDGSTATASTPVEVHDLSGVVAIAAGDNHSLALLSNGTVMAWGSNDHGQVGDGKVQGEESGGEELPVAVKGLSGVKAIAAGGNHSLALLSNGTVMAWGENEDGELGNGTHSDEHSPVAVKGLSGVSAIAAGGDFSLALTNKETVMSFGSDSDGQLADSAAVEEGNSDVPVPAEGLSKVSAIAAGLTHALALLSNGSVMAWGEDSYGELGNGSVKASSETPLAVSGLSGVRSVSAGGMDSLALLDSGSIMAWGTNVRGTLGNGTTGGYSDVPVEVSGVREAAGISAGGQHMLAFGEPVPVVTHINPDFGPGLGGNTVTITGVNLSGATKVTFGSAEASNVTVESSSTVTATAPAGSGTVDVEVSTPAGTSAPVSADQYTFMKPPTVKRLSVKSGPVGGGTTVVITGTEFTGATAVHFGAAEASSVIVNSATSITAVSPEGTVGEVDVTVTTPSGTSAKTTADEFKYTPTVELLAPNSGSSAGGTEVTVTGSGFALGASATTIKFGKTKARTVNCTSSTSCTVIAPAHAAETVDVTATVAKVTSPTSEADRFTYS